MSRNYVYKVDPTSLMTLCPACLHSFRDARKAFLRRADVHQQTKDVCTYCQSRYGFDYYIQPASAHNDIVSRKVRDYAAASKY